MKNPSTKDSCILDPKLQIRIHMTATHFSLIYASPLGLTSGWDIPYSIPIDMQRSASLVFTQQRKITGNGYIYSPFFQFCFPIPCLTTSIIWSWQLQTQNCASKRCAHGQANTGWSACVPFKEVDCAMLLKGRREPCFLSVAWCTPTEPIRSDSCRCHTQPTSHGEKHLQQAK